MISIIKEIIAAIKSIPWAGLREFLLVLFTKQKISLISCVALLIISVLLLFWYLNRSSEYERIVSSTLQTELEPTPQKFKGLEAFIMSNVDQQVYNNLQEKQISENFQKQFKLLKEKLDSHDFSMTPPEPKLHIVPDSSEHQL